MVLSFDHHAQLLVGNVDELLDELKKVLAGSSELLVQKFDSFGINDSRFLREAHTRKALVGDKRIFVIAAHFFTREAQNALLKTFEEPAPGVYFFVIAPSIDSLIPTVRSRMSVIANNQLSIINNQAITKFLNSKPAERMKIVGELLKKSDDPEEKQKIKIEALKFVKELQSYFARSPAPQASEVLKAQSQLSQPGAVTRLVIENLCLTL